MDACADRLAGERPALAKLFRYRPQKPRVLANPLDTGFHVVSPPQEPQRSLTTSGFSRVEAFSRLVRCLYGIGTHAKQCFLSQLDRLIVCPGTPVGHPAHTESHPEALPVRTGRGEPRARGEPTYDRFRQGNGR